MAKLPEYNVLVNVVGEYEDTRQRLYAAEKERTKLISHCRFPSGKFCHEHVYELFLEACKEGYYTYDETFDNEHCKGNVCDNCANARKLKNGDIAILREKFGHIKRRLAHYGKVIIDV